VWDAAVSPTHIAGTVVGYGLCVVSYRHGACSHCLESYLVSFDKQLGVLPLQKTNHTSHLYTCLTLLFLS
jgi:hypothetical protein